MYFGRNRTSEVVLRWHGGGPLVYRRPSGFHMQNWTGIYRRWLDAAQVGTAGLPAGSGCVTIRRGNRRPVQIVQESTRTSCGGILHLMASYSEDSVPQNARSRTLSRSCRQCTTGSTSRLSVRTRRRQQQRETEWNNEWEYTACCGRTMPE